MSKVLRESRTVPLELRIERSEGKTKIVGYFARFNSLSEDLGGYKELIAPGAFAGVLKDDVRALFNHDPNIVLGRSTAGTLLIKEDAHGGWMELEPPDTEQGRSLIVAIERGDVTGQSFTFSLPPMPEGRIWEEDEQGNLTRTITRVSKLWDVGPVTFPAYPETDVALRSADDAVAEARAVLGEREIALPNFGNMRKRLDLAASE
jgi:HK97 family phage prohead protease